MDGVLPPADYYAIGAKYANDLGLDNVDRQRYIMDGVRKRSTIFGCIILASR
jgi:hypothetical protein